MSVPLKQLFKTYLNESDSWEDYELRKRSAAPAVTTVVEAVPVQPVMTPVVQEPVQPTRTIVEIDESFNYGVQPAWFSTFLARKSAGPQMIHITFVEFFYDLIFAFVMSSFAVNISFGWPNGKWANFVEMLLLLDLWHDHVVFTNFAYAQDPISKFLIFLELLGVLGMSFFRAFYVAGGGSVLQGFVISFFWARFFQVLLWFGVVASRTAPAPARFVALVWGLFTVITCIPMAVTLGLQNDFSVYGSTMLWIITAGLDLLVGALLWMIPWWRLATPYPSLRRFRDRFGAFTLFFFFFMLIVLVFDETGPYSAGEWGSIALLFLIAFCFMWMYFDGNRHDDDRAGCVHPLNRPVFVWGYLWQLLHLPLAGALIIMADASVNFVYYYRGVQRLPNTVVPVYNANGQTAGLRLSNTVQWIYGVSFAVALGLIALIGILYAYLTPRTAKRKLERSIGRFALVIVMVLIPLGGLDGPMEPIIQPIVGAVVMIILVVIDWTFIVALGPALPDRTIRDATIVSADGPVVVAAAGPGAAVAVGGGPQVADLQARLAQRDQDVARLQLELAEARKGGAGAATTTAAAAAVDVDHVSSELSSSKDWGFSSRTSSVLEDVVASSEGDESQQFDTEEKVDMSPAGGVGADTSTEPGSSAFATAQAVGGNTNTNNVNINGGNNNGNPNNPNEKSSTSQYEEKMSSEGDY